MGAEEAICRQLIRTAYVDMMHLIRAPPRGKRDGVIGHISERENGNWMKKCVLRDQGSCELPWCDRSIWHPAWWVYLSYTWISGNFLVWFARKTCLKVLWLWRKRDFKQRTYNSPLGGPIKSRRCFARKKRECDIYKNVQNMIFILLNRFSDCLACSEFTKIVFSDPARVNSANHTKPIFGSYLLLESQGFAIFKICLCQQ